MTKCQIDSKHILKFVPTQESFPCMFMLYVLRQSFFPSKPDLRSGSCRFSTRKCGIGYTIVSKVIFRTERSIRAIKLTPDNRAAFLAVNVKCVSMVTTIKNASGTIQAGNSSDVNHFKLLAFGTFNCFKKIKKIELKKCTKSYNARAQPLFCALNLFFSDVAVAAAVVVFLSSLLDQRP